MWLSIFDGVLKKYAQKGLNTFALVLKKKANPPSEDYDTLLVHS